MQTLHKHLGYFGYSMLGFVEHILLKSIHGCGFEKHSALLDS